MYPHVTIMILIAMIYETLDMRQVYSYVFDIYIIPLFVIIVPQHNNYSTHFIKEKLTREFNNFSQESRV